MNVVELVIISRVPVKTLRVCVLNQEPTFPIAHHYKLMSKASLDAICKTALNQHCLWSIYSSNFFDVILGKFEKF